MTAETADQASPEEADFQLLADQLPNLIILAFDPDLVIWAATGGGLHDSHVQSLAAIGFKLEQARLRLGDSGSPEVDELLWQVTRDLSAEVTSPRRTIGRLRPWCWSRPSTAASGSSPRPGRGR